ncbi:MAG: hypothetical protein KKF46_03215 [Nanoarchaeota archaeon]|nr:hypothetical protein [Nanoarchaeota archaeon]MBU1321343.1 hypothetical protein [Nanoarchaeota archaeon]MBU1597266.1 hypothetical protein [Nanoarchaeota archaeon]MBU2441480.1 hypothetical protein [Nanoarchaeota archaeon]
MIEEIEDQELLDKIRGEDEKEKEDFKSIINKKNVNKWEMDEVFLGET